MTFEDYLQLFSNTYICKIENDIKYHSLCQKSKNVPEQNWFKFQLGDDFKFGEWGLDIVVQQMGNRIYRHKRDSDGIEFKNSLFQLTLISVGGNNEFEGIKEKTHKALNGDINIMQFAQMIHKFHGGCSYSGVPKLKKITSVIEQQLKQGTSPDLLEPELLELLDELDNVLNESKNYLI